MAYGTSHYGTAIYGALGEEEDMSASADCSISWAKETTYGTFVTPTRSTEFISAPFQWNKNRNDGKGMRVGSIVKRASRTTVTSASGSGGIDMLLASRGLGLLWEAFCGNSVSNLVSGSTYQQLHKLATAQGQLSVQKGTYNAGTNSIDPESFTGAVLTGIEIDSPNGEDIKIKWTFGSIKDIQTATAYTAVTGLYPASTSDEVFAFRHATLSIGGTLTAPTTTTLASSTGAISSCLRSFNLKLEREMSSSGFCYGQGGRISKPTTKGIKISGTFSAQYDGTAFRDAFLADTPLPLLFSLTGDQALSTGNTGYQFALPQIRLDGDLPASNEGGEIVVSYPFEGYHDTTTEPVWVVARTADAAL